MKVVLDTNVFVSGIHWAGNSEKILISWMKGEFKLISSLEIIEELVNTLMNFKKPMRKDDIIWWRDLVIKKSVLVYPKGIISIVKEDPDDNKFVEAAVEGEADYIVSQDKHLLKIKEYNGIIIIKPEDFLKIKKEN